MRAKATNAIPLAPVCSPSEALDSQVERWIQRFEVKYAPKSMIPIGLIDEKGSLGNQARQEPLVPESVERFTMSLKAGEYLPAVVVYPVGNKVRIIDGNNRFAAHKKAGSQFIPGYIVDENIPTETILRMTINANVGHGVTPDQKWRVKQAAMLVANGFTAEVAAADAGVSRNVLQSYQAAVRFDARAKALKIQGCADLANASKVALVAVQNDAVFYQMTRTAIDTGMFSDDVRRMIKETRALPDEATQIQNIATIAADRKLEEQQRKAGVRPGNTLASPRQSLISAIGKILHIDPAELARSVLTDLEAREVINRCYKAADVLMEVATALERREDVG